MSNIPSSLQRLRRFHLLASGLVVLFLVAIIILTWNSRKASAQFQGRKDILTHQLHTPAILLGQMSRIEHEGQRTTVQHTLSEWVSNQEILQRGDPSLNIEDPAEAEVLDHFELMNDQFRKTIKAIRVQLEDSVSDKDGLVQTIDAYAGEYKVGMMGIQQMWASEYEAQSDWAFTATVILILLTLGLLILESIMVGKPILDFLASNIRRKETFNAAERAHMKVVSELSSQKRSSSTTPGRKKRPAKEEVPEQKLSEQFPSNILVVEDHPANQKYVQKLFSKLGYTVDLASNGREAVGMALTTSYDLIFMDIQMPIMDGIQASYEILGSLEEEEQPTIIALTGSAEPEAQEKCLDVGMKDIIWKPVKRDQVVEAIVKWRKASV